MRSISRTDGYDYLLALPDNYAREPRRRWPLMLFLHGSVERGIDVWDVARQGPPRLLAGSALLTEVEVSAAGELAENFIVVAPQCPPHEIWDDAALLALLDELESDFNVDTARITLAGLSMGGFGAWSLGLRHPKRFAKLVAVCGGGRIADVAAAARRESAALRRLAVWAFHGALDRVVPQEESIRMIEALRAVPVADARLTVYPDIDHDSWTAAFAHPELYSWLRQQGR